MTRLKLVEKIVNFKEKRKIPYFPFSFLTFKQSGRKIHQIFEVREISNKGAQLLLKDGVLNIIAGQSIKGEFHWWGKIQRINAQVIWVRDKRFGVSFTDQKGLNQFLSVENILNAMQLVHKNPFIQYPANLKYWIHCDGPVEILVWDHPDGEWREFQIIFFKNFIEWVDGEGLKTGTMLTRRNSETSLFEEDEFLFQIDYHPDQAKIREIKPLLEKIPDDFLPVTVINFLKLKIGI